MRAFARFFGLICGAVVILIAARYGYRTSDNDFDGWIWAFMYGSVSLGGLFGHALGVRAWRHSKLVGSLVFAGSALALLISLSNSIGAMAGRGNEQQATRIQVAELVRDTRRSLKRAEDEREALRFTPTDDDAVQAARTRSAAATAAKDAECKYRGSRCREKEEEESKALADLEGATKNKAATDRAAKLDAGITAFKEKIEKAGPVLESNSQGNALARLFNLPEAKAATLSTYQNLAMALVIEFLIVISLVASEVLEHHETRLPPPEPQQSPVKPATLEPHESLEDAPPPISAPNKPRLIASSPEPIGSVAAIMAEIMEPSRGRVEFAEAYRAYVLVCRLQSKRPVSPEDYSSALRRLCESSGIELKSNGEHVYLLRVRINLPAQELCTTPV